MIQFSPTAAYKACIQESDSIYHRCTRKTRNPARDLCHLQLQHGIAQRTDHVTSRFTSFGHPFQKRISHFLALSPHRFYFPTPLENNFSSRPQFPLEHRTFGSFPAAPPALIIESSALARQRPALVQLIASWQPALLFRRTVLVKE